MAASLSRDRLASSHGDVPPLPTCFTIAFPGDDELDESAVAQRTAEHLGLPIEKHVVTEQMLADELEESCWLGEVPLWDLQHVAKKALSRYISGRGLKVVLNGDGSDELFGGYSFFVADRLLEDDKARAASLQSVSSQQRETIRREHAEKAHWYGIEDAESKEESKAAKALNLPPGFCNLAVSRHDEWLTKDIRELSDPFEAIRESLSDQEAEEMATLHPMRRGMLAWNKTILPNMIIAAISDGAEMAHGVESRPPLLDHVVAELAQTLPVDMLVHLEPSQPPTEKWIFREAVREFITDEVYKRRKHAFASPWSYQQGGPLYNKLRHIITQENVERQGFIDWDQCKDLVHTAFSEKNQLVFRKAVWLAQIISIGRQFGVQRYVPSAPVS